MQRPEEEKRKSTTQLLNVLLESDKLDTYLEEAETSVSLDVAAYIAQLMRKKNLKRAPVIKAAGLNGTYGYQIISGEKRASRDKLLQLAFGLQCTVDEAQHLLIHASQGALYPKNRRDGIIMYCLKNGYTLFETDDLLYQYGEDTIVDADDA